MCYSNCPYENYHGECTQPKMMGTKYSHCCDEEDEEEYDEYEEKEVFEKEDEFDDSNCN